LLPPCPSSPSAVTLPVVTFVATLSIIAVVVVVAVAKMLEVEVVVVVVDADLVVVDRIECGSGFGLFWVTRPGQMYSCTVGTSRYICANNSGPSG
jgi:hypothetical protein